MQLTLRLRQVESVRLQEKDSTISFSLELAYKLRSQPQVSLSLIVLRNRLMVISLPLKKS